MDDQLTDLLTASGWYPGRTTDVAAALEALGADGYASWPELEGFLTEYSGLRLSGPEATSPLWFDAAEAAEDTDPGWAADYAELAGQPLVPVGGYQLMTVFLDRAGRFYGGYDAEFGPLADDLPGLVATILFHQPMPRLSMRVSD